jgi:hypothetical protein
MKSMDDYNFSISDGNPLNVAICNHPALIPQVLKQIQSLSIQHQEYILLNCDLSEAIYQCPEQVIALLSALHQCPHSAMAFKKINDAFLVSCQVNVCLVEHFLKQLLKFSRYEQRHTIIHLHECDKQAIKPILEHLSLFPSHVLQQTLLERDQHQYNSLMKVIMIAPETVETFLQLIYNSPVFEAIMTYKRPDAEHHKSFTVLNIAKKYFLDLRDETAYSILLAYHHLAFHHSLREQFVNMVLSLPNLNYAHLKKDYVVLFLEQQIEKIEDESIQQNLHNFVNEYKQTGDYTTFINNYHRLLAQLPITPRQQFIFFSTHGPQDKLVIQLKSFIENHAHIDDHKTVQLIKPKR